METATNAVVEGRMEPMRANASGAPQVVVTGQFLFDNFVDGGGEQQVSRMNIVRVLAKTATKDQLTEALKDAVELAHKIDIKNGVPEKEAGPKRRQAQNVRAALQNVYGALKLAAPELEKLGFSEKTGYVEGMTLAKAALKAKGLKWNGSPLPTDESKAIAKANALKEAKKAAIVDAMASLTRGDDESMVDYYTRVEAKADDILAQAKKAELSRSVSKTVIGIVEKTDRETARAIADGILNYLTQTAEMSDEEVDAVLRAAGEAEATLEQEAEESAEA